MISITEEITNGARIGTETFGVALGMAVTALADDDENDTFLSLGLSLDYVLTQ